MACTCALSGALAARDLADDPSMAARHEQWMGKYGRVYSDAPEKARRLEVFKANVAFIKSANAGNSKFWLEANQFADITEDEFRATHKGYKPVAADKGRSAGFRYNDLPAKNDGSIPANPTTCFGSPVQLCTYAHTDTVIECLDPAGGRFRGRASEA